MIDNAFFVALFSFTPLDIVSCYYFYYLRKYNDNPHNNNNNNNSNKDNGIGDHKNDQNTTDRGDSALTGGDTTVEDAVTKQNSRPGVSYGQMLRNARVHDSDGLLTDHENAASGRTA